MILVSISCSGSPSSNLASFSGVPTSWNSYSYTYTATSDAPTLVFAFKADGSGQRHWYLDDVSVVDTANTNIELLDNGNFDNSSTDLTGWTQWCTNTCPSPSSTNAGQATSSGNCYSNNCYVDHCYGGGALDYLGQTFAATVGNTYTISFRIIDFGTGPNGATKAYVNVY